MSFDLIAWKTPRVTSDEEAVQLARRFFDRDEDPTLFGKSEDVLHFYDELLERYPDEAHGAPEWFVPSDRSDRVVTLEVRRGAPDEVVDGIVGLARKHDLVLYDPQGPTVHSPVLPEPPEDIPGQVRQALIGGGIGLVILYMGTLIPYKTLSWPLIGAGAFIAVMAVYSVIVLLWKPEWRAH